MSLKLSQNFTQDIPMENNESLWESFPCDFEKKNFFFFLEKRE